MMMHSYSVMRTCIDTHNLHVPHIDRLILGGSRSNLMKTNNCLGIAFSEISRRLRMDQKSAMKPEVCIYASSVVREAALLIYYSSISFDLVSRRRRYPSAVAKQRQSRRSPVFARQSLRCYIGSSLVTAVL